MAASTVGRIDTHTSAQCSPASVGLAQARPNNCQCLWYHKYQVLSSHKAMPEVPQLGSGAKCLLQEHTQMPYHDFV